MAALTPPWTAPMRLSDLKPGGRTVRLVADAEARKRVARALGLVSLGRLEGEVAVSPWLDGAELSAVWRGEVVQTCSLSAEDFGAHAAGEFTVRVVPADSRAAPQPGAEVVVDPDAQDPPDVLEGETFDVAGYLVEHLALELDPFPRKPGAAFTPPEEPPEPSPFAKLAALRPKA